MRINLRPPTNWNDFENLCSHLWKSIWGDLTSHQSGRSGQRQNGVDIYGRPPFHEHFTGIQCKGKNGNYGKKLTIKEIDKECNNAQNFQPQLDTFIMATTSPRDVVVQEHCRQITYQKKYCFEVDTWSWDDIEEEVQCRPEIMEVFYPTEKASVLVNEVRLSRITSSNKFHAFFSRPGLLDYLNKFNVDLLDMLTYEMAINAFEHGNATCFNVTIDGHRIIYKDDGSKFDPTTLVENEEINRGGSVTLKYAMEVFEFNYRYEESENILELTYIGDDSVVANQEIYSIELNVQDVFGRRQTEDLAIREIIKIPGTVSRVVIDIFGKSPAVSIVYVFFDVLQKLIKKDQRVRVYLPYGLIYYNDLVNKFKDESRFEFVLKE